MRNPTYLIRSRHQTYYFRWPLPDVLRCAGKTPYVKLSLNTRDKRQACQMSQVLAVHIMQAAYHPHVQALPHSAAADHLRDYLADMLKRMQHATRLIPSLYSTMPPLAAHTPTITELQLQHADISLQAMIERYMDEMQKAGVWGKRAVGQIEDCLGVLTDYMGKDYSIASLGYAQARQVKELLTQLPANRNKKRETRGLPITKQIAVQGIPRLSVASINKHLITYGSLFKWAKKQGYVNDNPFAEMLLKETRAEKRQQFDADQIRTILAELDKGNAGLANTDYKHWGALIALYTGARQNEIASLTPDDVQQENGIWYFDINCNDATKQLKTHAALRRIPIHSELLKRGLLEYVTKVQTMNQPSIRLLHQLTYVEGIGWGRKLERWFNGPFLETLGIKQPQLSFHSLRHNAVTAMRQAGIDNHIVRALVGHEREGVTEEIYHHGYTLSQLQKGIEALRYAVD